MSKLINKHLLNWAINNDYNNSLIYAKSDSVITGEFSFELMEAKVVINYEEQDLVLNFIELLNKHNEGIIELSKKELITAQYYSNAYFQSDNHELIHFYQVLSLPAITIHRIIKKNYLKLEAIIMFKYFEQNHNFIFGKHKSFFSVLNLIELDKNTFNQFNKTIYENKFYNKIWNKKYKELSLLYIAEGMAHIMSLQLSDIPETDFLDIEKSEKYIAAFKIFHKHISDKYINIRIKYLIFIYFCYFSCQHIDHYQDNIIFKPVRVFYFLCEKVNFYIEILKKLHSKCEKYTNDELTSKLVGIDYKNATQKQLISINSFLMLIPHIERGSNRYIKNMDNIDIGELFDYIKVLKKNNIDINDINHLVYISIFPEKFYSLKLSDYEILESNVQNTEFNYDNEKKFYKFIMNCKHILNISDPFIYCCGEHGYTTNKKTVIECQNEEGTAYFLLKLTGKKANELFII